MSSLWTETHTAKWMLHSATVTRTYQFKADYIPIEEALRFRAHNTKGLWGAADSWDRAAEHLGFFLNGKLQGVIRLNRILDGKLPLSDALPEFKAKDDDMQIGKLVIAHEARATRAVLFATKTLRDIINGHTGRVIATPLAQNEGGLSEKTFSRQGFERIYHPFTSHENRTLIPMMRISQRVAPLPKLDSMVHNLSTQIIRA